MFLENFLDSLINIFKSLLSADPRQNLVSGVLVLFVVFLIIYLFLRLFRVKD